MSCACHCTGQCVTYFDLGCQPPLVRPLQGRLGGLSLFRADNLLSTNSSPLFEPISYDFGAGPNIVAAEWPWVADTNEPTPRYFVHLPPRAALQFCWQAESPDGLTGHLSGPPGWNLVYTGNWELTNAEGERWTFVGFERDAHPKGRLMSYQGPGGEGYEVYDPEDPDNLQADAYTEAGHIKGLRYMYTYEGKTLHEYLDFSYASGEDGRERLQQATLRRQEGESAVENVQRVLFEHQWATASSSSSSSSSSGDCGSLGPWYYRGTVTHQVYEQGAWAATGTTYRQYYLRWEIGGFAGALKYYLDAEAYERLKNDPAVSDPLSASDALVAQYATLYLEYDATGRVSKRRALGGGEVTFSYVEGYTLTDDLNKYRLKTTETHADGSVRTRYTNFQGQVLLAELQESAGASERVLEFRQYDGQGNLTLHATPSALAGYSSSNGTITPTYQSEGGQYTVGLVHLYTYYSETTTGSGGGAVEGFQQYDKVRQGRDGSPILVRTYEYTEHAITVDVGGSSSSSSSSSAGSLVVTVYPLAKETRYRHEDGSGAVETRYSYSWQEGTVQMQERITTLPAIAQWQNGPGTSAMRTERFDTYGNLLWLRDERGFITGHQYAAGPGRISRTIQDVDDAQLTLPSGWSTPSGGGQHLVTDYQYDAQGRQTQVLGPEHDVDGVSLRTAGWTVYRDADHETWSAQGYAVESASSSSSSGDLPNYDYTLVNPVSLQKRSAAGTRSESIQATRASTSGPLVASDAFPQTAFARWSVSLFNNQSQLTATRLYHTIPSSGDGSSGTHYDETTYGYDALGRQNRVTSPGGTITRTVFDTWSRAVCVYLGTDDSGATDLDPTAGREPCSAAAGSSSSSSSASSASGSANNNMVLVSQQQYDDTGCTGCGGGSGGQLVSTTQHVDASTTRVTERQYDWRGRQEYVIPPADDQGRTVYTRYDFDNLDQVTKVERYHAQAPQRRCPLGASGIVLGRCRPHV